MFENAFARTELIEPSFDGFDQQLKSFSDAATRVRAEIAKLVRELEAKTPQTKQALDAASAAAFAAAEASAAASAKYNSLCEGDLCSSQLYFAWS